VASAAPVAVRPRPPVRILRASSKRTRVLPSRPLPVEIPVAPPVELARVDAIAAETPAPVPVWTTALARVAVQAP
jgi:hypothetical protein